MSGEKLILTPIGDGKYEVYADWNGIPKGFITDGGSIPSLFWIPLGHPFESDYIEHYVEHDYDYATGRIPRKEADQKLRDGLKKAGMGWFDRIRIYLGVRWFGRSHYNNAKKEVEDDVRLSSGGSLVIEIPAVPLLGLQSVNMTFTKQDSDKFFNGFSAYNHPSSK